VFSLWISLSLFDIASYPRVSDYLDVLGGTHASLFAFGEKFHDVLMLSSTSLPSSDDASKVLSLGPEGLVSGLFLWCVTSLTGNSSSSES
jgi:hypothetical protein